MTSRKTNDFPHFQSPLKVKGYQSTTVAHRTLNFCQSRNNRFRAASCSVSEQSSAQQFAQRRDDHQHGHAGQGTAADAVHGIISACFGTGISAASTLPRKAARRLLACIRSISAFQHPVVFEFGGVRCMGTYRGEPFALSKSTDRPVSRPTIWSRTFSRMLRRLFGLKTRLRASPRSSSAPMANRPPFEPSNDISRDHANGPATQSPPSSPKSSPDTKCGMCVSVRGHRRRAF